MSFTYCSSLGQAARSPRRFTPGLCTHWLLWTPGSGSGCLPTRGSGLKQSSNRITSVEMPCLSAMSRNWRKVSLQPGGVGFPHGVVHEDAHRVEAEVLRPAEFAVDGLGVEGFLLPHLHVVDRGAGQEIAADQPRLLAVPRPRFRGGPLACVAAAFAAAWRMVSRNSASSFSS